MTAPRFDFLTLFPEVIEAGWGSSLLARARENGFIAVRATQIRDFAEDRHRTVDDTPYGGGQGMVLRADVLKRAWQSVRDPALARGLESGQGNDPGAGQVATVLLSPQGRVLSPEIAKTLAQCQQVIWVCGHYEGVDERFIEDVVDLELSIGDYVLTGGELPALVASDVVSRFVPGVVGNPDSVSQDSFEVDGLLKYPQYTKPRDYEGRPVPEILLSGDHVRIARWRRQQMEDRTRRKRPDLIRGRAL